MQKREQKNIEEQEKTLKYPLCVTLDTNIFVANKFDFSQDSTLGLLAKFVAAGKIKVVLSNIVVREVEKHIIEEGNKLCGALRRLRKDILETASVEYLTQVGLDKPIQILDKRKYEGKSREVWYDFLKRLQPEILNISKIDLEAILNDYFNFNPPFENSDKKRKEFPDAFIANQIRERFGKTQTVAIISDDNGFIRACGSSKNHLYFRTLGDLFDRMSRQEKEYPKFVQKINELVKLYIPKIGSLLMNEDCIELYGRSVDKDGISEGFDYSDITVVSAKNISCQVRTIDEMSDEMVHATMLCTARIELDCFYEDYGNAVWDSETKSYYFLETQKNREIHSAKFAIRVEVNQGDNSLRIIPFRVLLNGDTLLERNEINKEDEYYDEMDLIGRDRSEFGFQPLDSYSEYLDEKLADSPFMTSVIEIFEEINCLYQECAEIAVVYDDFLTFIKANKSKDILKHLLQKIKCSTITFPMPSDLNTISNEDVDEIISWASASSDRLFELSKQTRLPDSFKYGDAITIYAGKKTYQFVVEEFCEKPSAGDANFIDIYITENGSGAKIAKGYVEFIVGYLNFDEDGGVGDGVEDTIEYSVKGIVDTLRDIANSIREYVEKEMVTARAIKAAAR